MGGSQDIFSMFFTEMDDHQLFHLKSLFDLKMGKFIENGLSESQALKCVAELIKGQLDAEIKYRDEKQGVE